MARATKKRTRSRTISRKAGGGNKRTKRPKKGSRYGRQPGVTPTPETASQAGPINPSSPFPTTF